MGTITNRSEISEQTALDPDGNEIPYLDDIDSTPDDTQ